MSRARGRKAVIVVFLATALVITPLVFLGVCLGYHVGDAVRYSKSVLAIIFSTVGFLAGMAILFKVIRSTVAWTDGPRS